MNNLDCTLGNAAEVGDVLLLRLAIDPPRLG
jgi:hypothetical protein